MEDRNIAIIGSGIMGSGIAQVAAMSGYPVVIRDISDSLLAKGRSKVKESLERMGKKGKLDEKEQEEILNSIRWTKELADCSNADVVIEAISEDPEAKKSLYRELDDIVSGNTIIATNTSSISISLLASSISKPERFIGMHWFNPAVIMKLIEIVKGIQTSEETVSSILEMSKRMKKETIVCLDSQGFVTTRVLLALRLECYRIYEEGIASKEDIDKALRLAFGHPMGQFELADFSGLDIEVNAIKGMVEIYGERFRPPQCFLNLVRAGRLGRKTSHGWYDYDD